MGATLAEEFKDFEKRSMLLTLRNLALVAGSTWVGLLAVGWVKR